MTSYNLFFTKYNYSQIYKNNMNIKFNFEKIYINFRLWSDIFQVQINYLKLFPSWKGVTLPWRQTTNVGITRGDKQ